jgi:hypothetical protein
MGLNVGHEAVYDWRPDAGSEERWGDFDGEVSLGCIGYPDLLPPTRPLVVRHPLQVTRSFLALRFWHDTCECHVPGAHLEAPYEKFFMARVPEIRFQGSPLARSVVHQVRWLEMGLDLSSSVWVLDDLINRPEALQMLGDECGAVMSIEETAEAGDAVGVVNTMMQKKRTQRELTVDDLLSHHLGQRLMDIWMECVAQSARNLA